MKSPASLKISRLADHRDAIPVLQQWFEAEWEPYYGPHGPGDAREDLLSCCRHSGLPLGLVAHLGKEICGTIALKAESVTTHAHHGPWLAALLVGRPFRRQGIAEALIAAAEETAHVLEIERLYIGAGERSGAPTSALHRRGWNLIDRAPYTVSEVLIFTKALSNERGAGHS